MSRSGNGKTVLGQHVSLRFYKMFLFAQRMLKLFIVLPNLPISHQKNTLKLSIIL